MGLLARLLFVHILVSVQGDYVLRVRPSGYANPDNTCHQCFSQGLIFPGCCDLFDTFSCSGDLLCDNEFFYCLIPIDSESRYSVDESSVGVRNISTRADQLGCLQPPSALRSITNFNGRAINFASDTVLGLPNPLEFEVTSVSWQGITLYADVIDIDSNGDDDLVDVFFVELTPLVVVAGTNMTTLQNFSGRYGIATIELSFQLECLPGFFGGLCLNSTLICDTTPCRNGGLCSPDEIDGYTCTCVGDFTGRSCDMTIDDCLHVNCNNGTCVDGDRTFTCECQPGHTGELCDQLVTVTITPSPDATLTSTTSSTGGTSNSSTRTTPSPDSTLTSTTSGTGGTSNSSVGVVGGVVGGVVIALLITVANILVLFLVVKWRGTAHRKAQASKASGSGPAATSEDVPIYECIKPRDEVIPTDRNVVYGITTGDEVILTDLNMVYGIKGDQRESDGVTTTHNMVYGIRGDQTQSDGVITTHNVVYGIKDTLAESDSHMERDPAYDSDNENDYI